MKSVVSKSSVAKVKFLSRSLPLSEQGYPPAAGFPADFAFASKEMGGLLDTWVWVGQLNVCAENGMHNFDLLYHAKISDLDVG